MTSTFKLKVPKRLVIAIGGNATHPENITGTSDEQRHIAKLTAEALLPLAMLDKTELIITHGNGPQVGNLLVGDRELALLRTLRNQAVMAFRQSAAPA